MCHFSFEAFAAWVLEQQRLSLIGMQTTTGEEFSENIEKFVLFGNMQTVIYEFKKQQLGANHGA